MDSGQRHRCNKSFTDEVADRPVIWAEAETSHADLFQPALDKLDVWSGGRGRKTASRFSR